MSEKTVFMTFSEEKRAVFREFASVFVDVEKPRFAEGAVEGGLASVDQNPIDVKQFSAIETVVEQREKEKGKHRDPDADREGERRQGGKQTEPHEERTDQQRLSWHGARL